MYTQEQMIVAVETYMQLHSTRKTIQCLGYPGSRNTLRLWINEYKKQVKSRGRLIRKDNQNILKSKFGEQLSYVSRMI